MTSSYIKISSRVLNWRPLERFREKPNKSNERSISSNEQGCEGKAGLVISPNIGSCVYAGMCSKYFSKYFSKYWIKCVRRHVLSKVDG